MTDKEKLVVGMIKWSSRVRLLIIPAVSQFTLLALAQVKNQEFEDKLNKDWKRDGPKVPRKDPGDKLVIRKGTNGNSYGHLGDRHDRRRNAEKPAHFYKRFSCDFDSIGDCQVRF